jgi:hypothetical protein
MLRDHWRQSFAFNNPTNIRFSVDLDGQTFAGIKIDPPNMKSSPGGASSVSVFSAEVRSVDY